MKKITIIALLSLFLNGIMAQTDSSINVDKVSDCTVFLYQHTSNTSGDTGTGTIINTNGKLAAVTPLLYMKDWNFGIN